jgi:aquaporin Z
MGAPAAYGAELLGTLMLVFAISMILTVNGIVGQGNFVIVPLLHVLVLMLLIHSLGGASGAHFNPAVTIALLVKRKIQGADAGIYIAMQLVGGVIGALLCSCSWTTRARWSTTARRPSALPLTATGSPGSWPRRSARSS